MILVEICAQSYRAALVADKNGAHRIELCTHLGGGGLTPSLGLIQEVLDQVHIPVFVLIRPRTGDFYYSAAELNIMEKDIRHCVRAGAHGIVAGCLTREDEVDMESTRRLIAAAEGLPFTFHRAFESIPDSKQAIETLIALGVSRILTGGRTGHAPNNRFELKALQQFAGERLNILAGSGVTPDNAAELVRDSQVKEIHSSAKYDPAPAFTLGGDPLDSDPDKVRALVACCMGM